MFKIFRHGERTPIINFLYPNDPYRDPNQWSTECSQLTNVGKQQLYDLGQWLRKLYGNGFLSNRYKFDEIYIRSTDFDRTIHIAQLCLAGLYPPVNNDIWNEELLWQPIPIHTVPYENDFLIAGLVFSCPTYNMLHKNVLNSPEYQKIQLKYKPLFDYLTEYSGFPINSTVWSTLYVYMLRDSLLTEEKQNKQ